LIPFVGAVLLLSVRHLFRAKAGEKNGCWIIATHRLFFLRMWTVFRRQIAAGQGGFD